MTWNFLFFYSFHSNFLFYFYFLIFYFLLESACLLPGMTSRLDMNFLNNFGKFFFFFWIGTKLKRPVPLPLLHARADRSSDTQLILKHHPDTSRISTALKRSHSEPQKDQVFWEILSMAEIEILRKSMERSLHLNSTEKSLEIHTFSIHFIWSKLEGSMLMTQ